MKTLLALMLALILGCASSIYDQGYEVIHGKLITVPIVDSETKRLTIYLAAEDGLNIIAIAQNKENFDMLRQLANNLGDNKSMLFLFCKPVGTEWHEYVDSVDYEVFGLGYYDYYAQRYVTVITTYGDSFTDVMRSQDWKSFTTGLIKKGIGAAL